MKKVRRIILVAIFLLPFIYWGAAILKCEYLTYQYAKEFDIVYKENTMIGEVEYRKVLDYSDTYAKVYYVSKNSGNILIFSKKDERWVHKSWKTVWSRSGSADDFMWPYIR